MSLLFRPVDELAELVRTGEVSSRELVQESLDRIERLNPQLNAFVDVFGDEALHARHRTGTEAVHDARPSEVTVPALSARTTVVTFPEADTQRFICHLPGHEAYGMSGTIRIVPAG